MYISDAKKLADQLADLMSPYCERIEIAGSIRRYKSDVKDIELVASPKWIVEPDASDLYGGMIRTNLLWEHLHAGRDIQWIKPGVPDAIPWQIKPDGKYWRGLLPEDIKLDLFLASRDNFGIIYLIRTGSADFSAATVTHAKRIGKPCVGGYLTNEDGKLYTPDEQSVFDALNLAYVKPENRIDGNSLRAKR